MVKRKHRRRTTEQCRKLDSYPQTSLFTSFPYTPHQPKFLTKTPPPTDPTIKDVHQLLTQVLAKLNNGYGISHAKHHTEQASPPQGWVTTGDRAVPSLKAAPSLEHRYPRSQAASEIKRHFSRDHTKPSRIAETEDVEYPTYKRKGET